MDSKPVFGNLSDRYEQSCRQDSDIVATKVAQKIEQGLGRSVRGEKDYSVIMMIGEDLVRFVKSTQTQRFFSSQTRRQIQRPKLLRNNPRISRRIKPKNNPRRFRNPNDSRRFNRPSTRLKNFAASSKVKRKSRCRNNLPPQPAV